MASTGIRWGVKNPSGLVLDPPPVRSNQIYRTNRFLSIPNSGIRIPSSSQRVSASVALSHFPSYSPLFKDLESGNGLGNGKNSQEKEPIFSDNLDGWVRDSVVEIVKNLKKAPLLVHVYSQNSGGLMELKTEEGVAENWPTVKKEWSEGERKSPDGIILVEELEDNKDLDLEIEEEERETKAWGVLIQGKGGVERECRPSCYLLKTCRVNSGLGFFGTHFCLVKVNSFRESAFSQIKNSWLLQ